MLLLFVVLSTSLALFDAGGIGIFVGVMLLAAMLRFQRIPNIVKVVMGVMSVGIVIGLLLPQTPVSRESRRCKRCAENLARIAAALRAYRAEHGQYPPTCVSDANGKTTHSWRIAILPYLGCKDLYEQYDFNQPWNGPKNGVLAKQRPDVFHCPDDESETETTYLAITGPGTAWNENVAADSAPQFRPQQLVLLIEVVRSRICWMEPRDSTPQNAFGKNGIEFHANLGDSHISGHDPDGPWSPAGHIVCADGSVRLIRDEIWTSMHGGMSTVGDAGQVDWEKLDAPVLNSWKPPHSAWAKSVALPIWSVSVALFLYRAVQSRKKAEEAEEQVS
jgi:type II secretory pathway pseudopilin PulG